jgi:hypothetical protein
LSGVDIPLLTISNNLSVLNDGKSHKEFVIMTARVHPGETCGSWMMEGFLKFILGDGKEAIEMRDSFIFVIVPMLNPDGVIVGNYRCDITGNDLNRKYCDSDGHMFPNIHYLLRKIKSIMPKSPVLSFIDLHAHSKKKSVFIYGPHFPLHNENYLKTRILPKLLSERTHMFRYYACKFRNEKSKQRAARIVVSSKFGIPISFTIEASFYAFLDEERKTVEFTRDHYELMVFVSLGTTHCVLDT